MITDLCGTFSRKNVFSFIFSDVEMLYVTLNLMSLGFKLLKKTISNISLCYVP